MDPKALLHKHNPVLVILPRDVLRNRPWNRIYKRVTRPRGDYHPASAEFFLSYVVQRRRKRFWNPLGFIESDLPAPTGLDKLRALVQAAEPGETDDWELDIAPIKSHDAEQAWAAYGVMLLYASEEMKRPVVYARFVPGPPAVLEYWYFYVYNDAPNKHEGDWEMVAVELDAAGEPVRTGYASHIAGYKQDWQKVEKAGDRPLVYVARGSHAAYYQHKPGGHRTLSLAPSKGLPAPLEQAWVKFTLGFQRLAFFLRLQDHTAAHPARPGDGKNAGELLEDIDLVVMPEREAATPDSGFWWMTLDCAWGSSHARLFGSAAPLPPWRQAQKWYEPAAWIDSLPAT